ncbi:MAG: glycosyltransferase, partial [Candidatus Gastranaerophilales bacterium]|nr:glycosyltransferase [Candidatus Gastranaerophilales bacterium]
MAEISVIVPVYNVKRYLKECLDSIINQTFKDIEIICINDGSTDGSEKILKEYENKEPRIILINKKNGGLSSARNAGMKIAKGKFLCFVDSDDKIELTMLEKLYKNITSLNSDISICAVHKLDETNKTIDDSNPYFNLGYFNSLFDNKVFSYEDVKPFLMNVCVMAWNKLYRHSFIKECNAEFPENLIFEDGPFFFSVFFKTKRVSIVRDFLYFYRINRKGSILKNCSVNFLDIIDVVNLMYEYLKQSPVFEDVKYDFYRAKADDIMYRYRLINFIFRYKFLKKLKKDSCLFDESVFDFAYINKTMPDIYKNLFIM